MISLYRLSSSKFSVSSGLGAKLYGGRWNSPGTEVIYAAHSPSLAALEILVHFAVLPQDFVLTEIRVPKSLAILPLDVARLPRGWDREEPIPATQRIGDGWASEGRYAILSVPSSIIPIERNYVINPAHPHFSEIEFGTPQPFRFDSRLK